MGFETDRAKQVLQDQYEHMKGEKSDIENVVTQWIDGATTLHSAVAGADYKADVVALRDELIANLRTILGV